MTIFKKLLQWWTGTPKPAPDSVESVIQVSPSTQDSATTVAAACGCGRSETGFCVGLHLLSDAEWAAKTASRTAPVTETMEEVAAEPVPAKPKRERKPRAARPAPQPAPEVIVKQPTRTSRKKAQ